MLPRCKLVLLDLAAVAVFAVIGRRSHDEGLDLAGVIETASPFLIGAAAGWLVLTPRRGRPPTDLLGGAGVVASTVVVGMLLRRFAFDEGTAASFVVVATAFNAITMLGWRVLLRSMREGSDQPTTV